MPIRHLDLRNVTTAPLKANATDPDWYGAKPGQNAAAVSHPRSGARCGSIRLFET